MTARTQAALTGGATIGVLSALPFLGTANLCCCAWVVTGGLASAYLQQQNQDEPLTYGQGATVGAMAGAFGAVIYLVVALLVEASFGSILARLAEQSLSQNPGLPPNVRDVLEFARSGGGWILVTMTFFLMLFIGTIISALAGTLGAVLFRKQAPPPPLTPPPIPPQSY